jgi:hypothetical protein
LHARCFWFWLLLLFPLRPDVGSDSITYALIIVSNGRPALPPSSGT